MATAAAKPDEDEPEEGDSNDEANYQAETVTAPVVETPPAPVSEPVADPTPATGRRAKRF
jgi:hypothetical protein